MKYPQNTNVSKRIQTNNQKLTQPSTNTDRYNVFDCVCPWSSGSGKKKLCLPSIHLILLWVFFFSFLLRFCDGFSVFHSIWNSLLISIACEMEISWNPFYFVSIFTFSFCIVECDINAFEICILIFYLFSNWKLFLSLSISFRLLTDSSRTKKKRNKKQKQKKVHIPHFTQTNRMPFNWAKIRFVVECWIQLIRMQ